MVKGEILKEGEMSQTEIHCVCLLYFYMLHAHLLSIISNIVSVSLPISLCILIYSDPQQYCDSCRDWSVTGM